MGDFWLHSAVKPLEAALGTRLNLYKGFSTRCRSSGGFDDIRGIVMHHDADNTSGDDDWVVKYEYETAADGPIGNFHVNRNGYVWFGAAGASNHAGKGGPVSTSRGTVPLNAGNKYLIGIEASNNGVGEVWSKPLMESYLILVTVLCKTFQLNPLTDIYGHWTWCEPSCPGRKIDPRGPTPSYPKFGGTSGTNKWNMDEVRKEINARVQTTEPKPEPPGPPPPLPEGIHDMLPMIGKYPNQGVWVVSLDGGYTHKSIRNSDWAHSLIIGGAIDPKSKKVVTAWSQVPGMTDSAEVAKFLGTKTG